MKVSSKFSAFWVDDFCNFLSFSPSSTFQINLKKFLNFLQDPTTILWKFRQKVHLDFAKIHQDGYFSPTSTYQIEFSFHQVEFIDLNFKLWKFRQKVHFFFYHFFRKIWFISIIYKLYWSLQQTFIWNLGFSVSYAPTDKFLSFLHITSGNYSIFEKIKSEKEHLFGVPIKSDFYLSKNQFQRI